MPDATTPSPYETQRITFFRRLLDRVPDDIILRIDGHRQAGELDLNNGCACICGWAMRERAAEILGMEVAKVFPRPSASVPAHGSLELHRSQVVALAGRGCAIDGGMTPFPAPRLAAKMYGGDAGDWKDLYDGAATSDYSSGYVMAAFEQRVAAAQANRRHHRSDDRNEATIETNPSRAHSYHSTTLPDSILASPTTRPVPISA